MTDLRDRLARLSPGQRTILARRIQATRPDNQTSAEQPLRLVAYVTANGQEAPGSDSLRRFVRDHLPEYMTPSAFVLLDELPRLPNGKVNRAVLPEPDQISTFGGQKITGPRNQIERDIAGVWQAVLGIDHLDVRDNFFELGGDSLLVLRVVAKLRDIYDVKLPVSTMFESPTIEALAERVAVLQLAAQPQLPFAEKTQEEFLL